MKMRSLKFIMIASLFSFCQCSSNSSSNTNTDTTQRSDLISKVSSWAYQLQNMNTAEISAADIDLIVTDYSTDGTDETAFSANDVSTMKGANNKLVIAYLSIGEAEDYRYYFDANADYIDAENPNWPGNFKIHYWEESWQTVINGYLDKIIAAGFDGVYLDIIDAYEYYGPGGDSGLDRSTAADDMVEFVLRIAERAREQNEKFLIFPQNGSGIINDSTMANDYLDTIDGIGAEDTFYFGDADEDNPLNVQDQVVANLDTISAAGKLVLSVEYLTDDTTISEYQTLATDRNYIPVATTRALDEFHSF